jgi:hypothetical protein
MWGDTGWGTRLDDGNSSFPYMALFPLSLILRGMPYNEFDAAVTQVHTIVSYGKEERAVIWILSPIVERCP